MTQLHLNSFGQKEKASNGMHCCFVKRDRTVRSDTSSVATLSLAPFGLPFSGRRQRSTRNEIQIRTLTMCEIHNILCDHSPQRGRALYEEIKNPFWNEVTDDGIVTEHTQSLLRYLPRSHLSVTATMLSNGIKLFLKIMEERHLVSMAPRPCKHLK